MDEDGILIGSCFSILSDELFVKRVTSKLVPKLITVGQTENRNEVCLELKSWVFNDKCYIKLVIRGDETLVYGFDSTTKFQSSRWSTEILPRPKKCPPTSKQFS